MISLREKLPKIGIEPGTPVSFMGKIPVGNGSYHPGNFVSRPKSLREAIRSMDAPQNWQQVSDSHYDEYWTDEVQGVACDGENWIFSCNAKQWKPGHNDKAIYVFKGGAPLKDGNWIFMMAYKDVPHPKVTNESDEHWGQVSSPATMDLFMWLMVGHLSPQIRTREMLLFSKTIMAFLNSISGLN